MDKIVASGFCGAGKSTTDERKIFWSVTDDGKLRITGAGKMQDYHGTTSAPWGTGITSVCVEKGVTHIGCFAFFNCKNLESVELQEGVVCIGEGAFMHCGALKEIRMPDTVEKVGMLAFAQCKNLSQLTLSRKTLCIGAGAFMRCLSLESVFVPRSVVRIGDHVFRECTSLAHVYYDGAEYQLHRVEWNIGYIGCPSRTKIHFLSSHWQHRPV